MNIKLCRKDSCRPCEVVSIIKNYVKPLMQLLTNEQDDIRYYVELLYTTKCLNTSVMLLILLLGKESMKIARYCNSNLTVKRHQESNNPNLNSELMISLGRDILRKNFKDRYIYYILLTDGNFQKEQNTVFFPGHVFIVEKFKENSKISFNLYQSYINEYDLNGHYERSNKVNSKNGVKLTYKHMESLLTNLHYVLTSEIWDERCTKIWKEFTFVETENLRDSKSRNNFFLCYQKTKATSCAQNVYKYIKDKLKAIQSIQSVLLNPNEIYGDKSLYHSSQVPLTNREIKQSLINMKYDLETFMAKR